VRVEDGKDKRQDKKDRGEPAGDFGEHIRRLRAENVLRHPASKRGAQAFAFGPLHQDHQHHEQRDTDEDSTQNTDRKVHWDGQYRQVG